MAGVVTTSHHAPAAALERLARDRRQAEDQERRRDVGADRVLREVGEQQVVRRDRLERRVEGHHDAREAEPEEHAPAGARGAHVPDVQHRGGDREHDEERLEGEAGGGRRVHAAVRP